MACVCGSSCGGGDGHGTVRGVRYGTGSCMQLNFRRNIFGPSKTRGLSYARANFGVAVSASANPVGVCDACEVLQARRVGRQRGAVGGADNGINF